MKRIIFCLVLLSLLLSVSFAEEDQKEFVFRIPHEIEPTADITGFPGNKTILGSYTGEVINGIPNGHGLFEFVDLGVPCHYLGNWTNGEMTGSGGLYWILGESMYGIFEDNVMTTGQIFKSTVHLFRDTVPTSK